MRHSPTAALVALALSAAPAAAQLDLAREGGLLGATVDYGLAAAPGTPFALLPSLQPGPLPLAVIDPLDPRVLGVGLDLPSLWTFGVTDGTGAASVVFPLPVAAALQGTPLYAQAVSFPGSPTLVDDISPRTAVTLGAPGTSVFTAEDLPLAIAGHTATELVDGRVLLAGGGGEAGGLSVPGDRLYLFDPQTQATTQSPATLATVRAAHTATRLADGRVLLVGGSDAAENPLATAELYDPATDTVVAAASMPTPRVAHTATLLADGRVFVAGGANGFDLADPLAGLGNILSSTLVYDPVADAWSNGPNLPQPRVGHAASRLTDGRVLLTGGLIVTNLPFVGPVPSITADARFYVPASNSLAGAPEFSGARALHAQTTLDDGRVLVAGGATIDILSLSVTTFSSTRVFSGGGWANGGALSQPRVYAQAFDLGGGRAAVVGGLASVDTSGGTGAPATAIEVGSGSFGAWDGSTSTLLTRLIPASATIEDGERLLITGAAVDPFTGATLPDTSAETYLP